MVALDASSGVEFARRHSIPTAFAGIPLGAIAGIGMILHFEIAVLTSLLTLACLVKRAGWTAVAAWGASYVLVTGVWLFPAANGMREALMLACGLPLLGAIFYGGAGFLLSYLLRSNFTLAFGLTFGLGELGAAQIGLSQAPIGLAVIGYGAEWAIVALGVYGTGFLIAILAALLSRFGTQGLAACIPIAVLALAIPGVERPAYAGPEVQLIAHDPDAFQKWTPSGSMEAMEKLVALSRETPGKLHLWPENAVTSSMRVDEAVRHIPPDVTPVLFGMTRLDPKTGTYHNAAVFVDEGGTYQISEKEHLLPVAETGTSLSNRIPLSVGERRVMTSRDGSNLLVLICYDIAFGLGDLTDLGPLDAIYLLTAETGFWQPVGSGITDRHIRAREIETGLHIVKVSDWNAD